MAENQHQNQPFSKLSSVVLSPTERQEIWQELDIHMQHLEAVGPRKRRTRVWGRFLAVAASGVAAALVIGVLLTNDWLPLQNRQQVVQPPNVSQPKTPTTPTQPVQPAQPGDTHSATPPTPNTPPSTVDEQAQRAELQTILQRAHQGKVPGIDFAAHTTTIDAVYKVWGDPDRDDAAGRGFYKTYTKQGYVFGVNKGEQIFDVRSFQPDIQKITLSAVKAELGNPDQLNRLQQPDQDVMIYQVNDLYQLQLIFPHPTTENPNPHLDHISVFCEQDSHNYMAGQGW